MNRALPSRNALRLCLYLIILIPTVLAVISPEQFSVADYRNPVEWLQVLVLLAAFVIHLACAADKLQPSLDRIMRISLAGLSICLALREIDLSQVGLSPLMHQLDQGIHLLKIGLALCLAAYLLMRSREILGGLGDLMHKQVLRWSLYGGLLLLVSDPFDRNIFHLSDQVAKMIEEHTELLGYALLFHGATAEQTSPNCQQR